MVFILFGETGEIDSMKIYNFLFFSLYSIVPVKAMLGRRTVAVILLSLIMSCFFFCSYLLVSLLYQSLRNQITLNVTIITTTVSIFYINTQLFEKKDRFKRVIKTNEPTRPFHKFVGVFLLFASYLMFIMSTYFVDRYIDLKN